MHGHHGDAVIVGADAVQVRVEGDLIEEAREGGVLWLPVQEAQDVGLQLLDVLDAAPALHVVLLLQGPDVAGVVQHLVIELRQGQPPAGGAEGVDEVGELQELRRSALELREEVGVPDGLVEGELLLRRHHRELLDGGVADAPGGDIDDPPQAQVVQGVIQDAQVGEDVLHLRPVKELGAAHDAVGDAVALHGVFQGVGLGVGAVEHGVVPELPAPVDPHQDVPGHEVGLVPLVEDGADVDGLAAAALGPEGLALAAGVVGDDGVGGVQDVLGGAVVLLQPDEPGLGILLLKAQDVLNVGPPEAVDALVVVAHHAEVLPPPGEKGREQILQMVGVLVLVHQHVAELPLVVLQHLRAGAQQRHRVEDEVVEVQGVGRPELGLIPGVDLGDAGVLPVPLPVLAPGEVLRRLIAVLGPADDAQHLPGSKGLLVQVQLPDAVPHHPLGVVRIVDGEVLLEAQVLDVPPQDPHTGGVEGGGPDLVGGGPQPGRQPLLQLSRRLVGEGDGQHLPGPGGVHGAEPPDPGLVRPAERLREVFQEGQVLLRGVLRHLGAVAAPTVGQKVIDSLDQHRGLAAARTRQQQEGSLRGEGGLLLGLVEPPEVPGDGLPPGGDVAFLKGHAIASFRQFSS